MTNLIIEPSPYSVTEYFWGYYDDRRFSIMVDADSGYSIEWMDAAPDDYEGKIEKEIIAYYEENH